LHDAVPPWTSVMVHIYMIQYCAIMCGIPSVQNSCCCYNVASSSSIRTKWYLILSSFAAGLAGTSLHILHTCQ
jgi:hypothetical protein